MRLPVPHVPIVLEGAATNAGSIAPAGRIRPRGKLETDEKSKKPADGERKKPSPARKAPARGRYVDEYARVSI